MGGNLPSYFRETCLVVKWSDRVDMMGLGGGNRELEVRVYGESLYDFKHLPRLRN